MTEDRVMKMEKVVHGFYYIANKNLRAVEFICIQTI